MWSVLSLDVSAACTGWCIIHSNSFIKYGTIKANSKEDSATRLLSFRQQLISILNEYKPTHIIIEDVYSGLNVRTLKLLSEFAGVAKETCKEFTEITPYVISNNTVKSYFKVRTKEELFYFVTDIFDNDTWSFKKDNDIVDAIAMCIYYLDIILGISGFKDTTDYGFIYKNIYKES